MPSDFEPVCPKCGDLNPPGSRVCETCGSYLLAADAQRDHLIRFEYFRRERRYPQVGITPVEENLLDRDPGEEVQGAGDRP